MEAKKSVFEILNSVNCNQHTEKKNGLTYLSWAWAWAEVKKAYPLAFYTIYETPEGRPYFDDGRTAWVKTGVTIEGLEHIEYLPIMDYKNVSIPLEKVTSMDMNKTIQRSLTKACARHGLGLYIYAGEDLPEDAAQETPAPAPKKGTKKTAPAPAPAGPIPGVEHVPIPDSLEFHPIDKDTYWKVIAAEARGEKTKSGITLRQWYIKTTHAREEHIDAFDRDVQDYKSGVLNQ